MKTSNYVLILDYGSQYTQLIARRVREARVYSEIHPFDRGLEVAQRNRPGAIILSGGPASIYKESSPWLDPELIDLQVPVLGKIGRAHV